MTITKAHLLMAVRGRPRTKTAKTGAGCVVVRGPTDRGSYVLRVANGSPPVTGAPSSVFELLGIFDPFVGVGGRGIFPIVLLVIG